jgi:hypothetical protein
VTHVSLSLQGLFITRILSLLLEVLRIFCDLFFEIYFEVRDSLETPLNIFLSHEGRDSSRYLDIVKFVIYLW